MAPKALKPLRVEASFSFCSLVPPIVRMSAVNLARLVVEGHGQSGDALEDRELRRGRDALLDQVLREGESAPGQTRLVGLLEDHAHLRVLGQGLGLFLVDVDDAPDALGAAEDDVRGVQEGPLGRLFGFAAFEVRVDDDAIVGLFLVFGGLFLEQGKEPGLIVLHGDDEAAVHPRRRQPEGALLMPNPKYEMSFIGSMPLILTNSSYLALAWGFSEGLLGGVGRHGPGDVDGHDAHGRSGQQLDQGLAGCGAGLDPELEGAQAEKAKFRMTARENAAVLFIVGTSLVDSLQDTKSLP
ncbi:MAG: hypothetical protein M0C28_38715 [Candidatus Moduliflexus flocculans]|nr:hypothetical protein [Candidatus Moduliflexus flocculans]